MRNRILTIASLLFLATVVAAQTTVFLPTKKGGVDTRVKVNSWQVVTANGKTVLTAEFNLDSLEVASNRFRAFTPVLVSRDSTQRQRLKSLLVTGRRQEIVFLRDGVDGFYADNHERIRRLDGQPQTYSYTDAVDRQDWHQGADLWLECDLCGCGDSKDFGQAYLGTLQRRPSTNPDSCTILNCPYS